MLGTLDNIAVFDRLAGALDGARFGPTLGQIFANLRRSGGLWPAVAEGSGVLAGLPTVDVAAGALPVSPKRPWFARGTGANLLIQPFHRAGATFPQLNAPDQPHLLAQCYGQIWTRSADWAVQLFAPFWRDMPLEDFVGTTDKAIIWHLAAHCVATRGPDAILSTPTIAGSLKEYHFTKDDFIGDLLSLHLDVEHLMTIAAQKLQLRPAYSHSRPGGLRRQNFGGSFAALLVAADDGRSAARQWLTTLREFIGASPLTRLVYLDLVTDGDSAADVKRIEARDPGEFTPLLNLQGLFRSPEDGDRGAKMWHEMWYSHLARSLVAAVMSPTPVYPIRLAAQERRQRPGAEHNGLSERQHQEYWPRMALLTMLFGDKPAISANAREGIDSNRLQRSYLHMRFLDMLVRQLAADGTDTLRSTWCKMNQQSEGERMSRIYLDTDGPLFRSMTQILFGEDWDQIQGESSQNRHAWRATYAPQLLIPRIVSLDPEPRPLNAEFANAVGVPIDISTRAILRFGDDSEGGVEIPVGTFVRRAYAPRTILADWITNLANGLARQVTSQERPV